MKDLFETLQDHIDLSQRRKRKIERSRLLDHALMDAFDTEVEARHYDVDDVLAAEIAKVDAEEWE